MSVQFVLGRAGSGKSEYIYKSILKEAHENPSKNYYLFVPEQYTLTAQLDLLSLSKTKALFNVEALSFSRFARRVFNELGTNTLDVLEDTGKSLLISKILKEKNDSLVTLKNSLMNQGGVDELKSLFSEFYQYGVKSEDLEKIINSDEVNPFFKKKGEDLLTLFNAFKEEINGRFFTAEEIPALLCDVIDSSLLVKNSVFYFDGFTGFTPVQLNVLGKMMRLSEKLIFSFTIDTERKDLPQNEKENDISETDLFYLTKKSIYSIEKLCEYTGTKILEDEKMPSPSDRRFKVGSSLLFLEENIFSNEKAVDDRENDEIEIRCLKNPRDEISFICSEISRLIRTGRYHYRDFAVLSASAVDYEFDAPHIFENYNIPYFMDSNVGIFFNPLLEFIESVLRIIRYNFKSEDVINFMRTGLSDFEEDEIDLFDDYLFSSGYLGKKSYLNDFTLVPNGFNDDDLVKINEIRKRLVSEDKLSKFIYVFSDKDLTYKKAATALFNLLSSYDVERKLYDMHLAFSRENDEIHSKEYEEIFGKVIEVIDRMVRLLSDSPCDISSFSDDLIMLLSGINVGVLPYSNDCVVIGDMERSRVSEIKVLFLLGCHDGNIPGDFGNGGLLSDSEREKLSTLKISLSPTKREKAFIKKFYLYLALTRESEKLYVTYTKEDRAGNSVLPSYLVLDLRTMFPAINIKESTSLAIDRIYSKKTISPFFSKYLRDYALNEIKDEDKKIFFSLYDILINDNSNASVRFKYENAAFYDGRVENISKALIEETHREEKTGEIVLLGSVSNLEKYFNCPYEYFLKYDLRLKEKEEYGFKSIDLGNIYHHVMQNFSNTLLDEKIDFSTITDEKIEEILSMCIDKEMDSLSKGISFSSAFEKNVINNIRATLRRTIKEFSLQLNRGHYFPRAFEYSLDKAPQIPEFNSLSGGGKLRLKGSIDRIDTSISANTNEIFLRIIDYKTGHKTLDLDDVENGLELQLFTYLDSALRAFEKEEKSLAQKENRLERKVLPGGVYFSQIKNPILKENAGILLSDEDYSKRLLEAYKLEGMTYSNENNLHAIDNAIFKSTEKKRISPVSGFTVRQNDTVSENSKVVPAETLYSYINLVRKKEIEAAENILGGDIRKYPFIKKSSGNTKTENTACLFCPYKDVCGFDPSLRGNHYRIL